MRNSFYENGKERFIIKDMEKTDGLLKEISMPTDIKITVKNITVEAELFDTACAKAIVEKLPLEAVSR